MLTPADGGPGVSRGVIAALERARQLGYLGDGPVETQIPHALGFAQVIEELTGRRPDRFLDLGSGGGLPGLVLADRWPGSRAVLLDAAQRRTAFLSSVVEELGWSGRVEVMRARAEEAGRDADLRGSQALVTARSFGPPAVVAECAAPLLAVGGILVVSEPPGPDGPITTAVDEQAEDPRRWPAESLSELGLEPVAFRRTEFGFQVLRLATPCPKRYPRRSGIPAKRPLYR